MPVVIKLKGLPWVASSGDIKQFFRGSKLAEHDVHLAPNEDGKACGVGFACFYDDEDARKAMQRNGAYMGKRYIELFLSSQAEMEKALRDGIPGSTLQERSPKKGARSPNRGERSADRSRDRSRSPRKRSKSPRRRSRSPQDRPRSSSNRNQDIDKERNGSRSEFQSRRGYGGERGNTRGSFRGRGTRGGFRGRGRGAPRGSRGGMRGSHSFKPPRETDNRLSRGRGQFRSDSRGHNSFFSSSKTQGRQSAGLQPVGANATSSLFLKLSGLPYTAQNTDIINFFKGINITAVHIIPNKSGPYAGRSSGSAFVESATQADCVKALQKHGEYLGKRYINVVRSTFEEIVSTLDIDLNLLTGQLPAEVNSSSLDMPATRSEGSSAFQSNSLSDIGTAENPAMSLVAASANINLDDIKDGCVVGIRNLPTIATPEEIVRIFHDFRAIPDSVRIHYLDVNRCSGDAMITLVNNDEARRAIRQLSGKQFGNKKIELFLL